MRISFGKQWRGASTERRILPPDVGGLSMHRAPMLEFRPRIPFRVPGSPSTPLRDRPGFHRLGTPLCIIYGGGSVNWFTASKARTDLLPQPPTGGPKTGFS
jgi:hypothetical protein